MSKRNVRILKEIVNDIDLVIAKVHSLRVDFSKDSIYQRLVSDLDGARVTARATTRLEEKPNVPNTNHPQDKHTDGRLRHRKEST